MQILKTISEKSSKKPSISEIIAKRNPKYRNKL